MKKQLAALFCVLFALCTMLSGCDYGTYPYEFEGSRWRAVELNMYFEVDDRYYEIGGSSCFGVWERNGEQIKITLSFGHNRCVIEPLGASSGDIFFFRAGGDFEADRFVMNLANDSTRRVQGDDIPLRLTFIRVDGTPRDHDKWFKSEPAAVLPDRREERA